MSEPSLLRNTGYTYRNSANGRLYRAKSYDDIEKQAHRLEMENMRRELPDNVDTYTKEQLENFRKRDDQIAEIRQRYLGNITSSERFQSARKRFNEAVAEISDEATRRSNEAFDEMYGLPYPQSTYMRNKKRNR